MITAQQLLELAAQGTVSDVSLVNGQFQNLDLSEVHFLNVDASGADFSGCKLGNTWWQHSQLNGTVFTQADFTRATLESCVMQGVHLPQRFGPVLLQHCQLPDLKAMGANWYQVQMRTSSLPAANFQAASFEQCAFNQCQLPNADFSQVQAPYLSFWCSTLTQANFQEAHLPGVIFDQAQLQKTNFKQAYLPQSRWVSSVATEAVFSGVDLSYADVSHMQATACDFSFAVVQHLNTHGAQLQGVNWQGCDNSTLRGTDPVLFAAENWQPDNRWEQPL